MRKEKQITNFALDPDEETLSQFKECYSEPYVVKAALMPDAHRGYVAPIGAVLATKNVLVPAWVGYDIGCGMTAAKLPKNILSPLKKKSKEVYNAVKRNVPMGLGRIHQTDKRMTLETKKEFQKILARFSREPHDKQVLHFLESEKIPRNLGTLGHGNHFIELDLDSRGNPWIVVHSGSRGVGHWLATRYMEKSSGKKSGFEATHPLAADSKEGKEYQNLLNFCLEFAKLNRLEIVRQAVIAIESVLGKKLKFSIWTNKNHNHALKEAGLFVHRKGATPAKRGERGIIPANMRDGSFLVVGKGNKKFISSSSHGAGRAMSRSQAREKISASKFKEEMSGANIVGDFSEKYLDEAPAAYKDIYRVLELQKESIKVVRHLRPFINWK